MRFGLTISLIFTRNCMIITVGGDNMVKTTAMLCQEYGRYSNPQENKQVGENASLAPRIKGLYETGRSSGCRWGARCCSRGRCEIGERYSKTCFRFCFHRFSGKIQPCFQSFLQHLREIYASGSGSFVQPCRD